MVFDIDSLAQDYELINNLWLFLHMGFTGEGGDFVQVGIQSIETVADQISKLSCCFTFVNSIVSRSMQSLFDNYTPFLSSFLLFFFRSLICLSLITLLQVIDR